MDGSLQSVLTLQFVIFIRGVPVRLVLLTDGRQSAKCSNTAIRDFRTRCARASNVILATNSDYVHEEH